MKKKIIILFSVLFAFLFAKQVSAQYVLYSDTAVMLSKYLKNTDTSVLLNGYILKGTSPGWLPVFTVSGNLEKSAVYQISNRLLINTIVDDGETTVQINGAIKLLNSPVLLRNNRGTVLHVGGDEFGNNNVSLGLYALGNSNSDGCCNVAFGNYALQSNQSGVANAAIGFSALVSNTSGNNNTAFGNGTLALLISGDDNTALGANALEGLTTGTGNLALGKSTMISNKTGSYNTAIGFNASLTSVSGEFNTIIGSSSGEGLIDGERNTIIGANVKGLSSGLTENVIISDGAGNQRIQVKQSGSVLIGYPNNSSDMGNLLDVNGKIRQTAVKSTLLKADVNGLIVSAGKSDYLSPADTASWLRNYARKTDVALISSKLNVTDTSAMLRNYIRKYDLSQVSVTGSYNDLINKPDFSVYARSNQLQNYLQLTGGTLSGAIFGTEGRFSGDLHVKKLIVTPNSWSDYVFDKRYKLRSLTEVENYIQQNKHLPDVPSAKEVGDIGISVGENQAVLLRKIEELTLYIIEQQKRIEQLEHRIKKIRVK